VNQGGKRKGAVCTYLETWHLDIEEFLELRKNTGDDRRRTHDMNTANWIPDLFMKRVIEGGEWTLFSPADTPDLHDKWGREFEKAYTRYESLAASGQIKLPDSEAPVFGPTRRLDYEVELGFVVGPGNRLGVPIAINEAKNHLLGVVLLNDWSARDVQAWEYQPLGPFLAKSFATTISPWIVTFEALEPFRCAAFERPPGDPKPLPYLLNSEDQGSGGLDIGLEMLLSTEGTRKAKAPPLRLSRGNARDAYWTAAQMLAHHSSNGCNLQAGDLFGSGTLSGAAPESAGSLMELTQGGKAPLRLPSGESRLFLEDGDEVTMRGRCEREDLASLGWGDCRGLVRAGPTKRQH
jgi:fumarylacetoacetase